MMRNEDRGVGTKIKASCKRRSRQLKRMMGECAHVNLHLAHRQLACRAAHRSTHVRAGCRCSCTMMPAASIGDASEAGKAAKCGACKEVMLTSEGE
eukprot:6205429-Pleurochrysis_carterae.AAC.1